MEVLKQLLGVIFLPFWYCFESFLKNCLDFFVPTSFRDLKDISGEVVLVTGGGAGLGRSLAIRLAELDAIVVTWDINEKGNEDTVQMIRERGGNAHAYTVDIGKAEEVYAAAKKVKGQVGNVTILVTNAAIGQSRPVWEIPDSVIQKMMTTNATAQFWLMKAFLPSMKAKNHGHIVSVLSGSINMVPIGLGAYIASKSAALGLHQAVQAELAFEKKTGVHTTAAFLDFIATDMTIGRLNCGSADVYTPEEVACGIVDALRMNLAIYTSAKLSFIFYLFKNFIPSKFFFRLFELGGVTSIFPSRTADNKAKDN